MLYPRRRWANSCTVIGRPTPPILAASLFVRPHCFEKRILKSMQPALTLKIPPIPLEQIFAQFQEQIDKVTPSCQHWTPVKAQMKTAIGGSSKDC
jgi:hypothetical protein